jgi:hypothetical protein
MLSIGSPVPGLIAGEVRMTRAVVFFVVLLTLFPAFGQIPKLDVKAICEARSADAKKVGSPPDQSITDCMTDEESAKQQLNALWATTPVPMRKQCQSDARSLGVTSYLDLLTCIQIAQDTKSRPRKEREKQ